MWNCIAVGAGGFIGSVLRYLLGMIPVSEKTDFPLITLMINLMGALAIGLFTGIAAKSPGINQTVLLFLKVGICGGFTTFSTFALETSNLINNGKTVWGLLYIFLSVFMGTAAVMFGKFLVK